MAASPRHSLAVANTSAAAPVRRLPTCEAETQTMICLSIQLSPACQVDILAWTPAGFCLRQRRAVAACGLRLGRASPRSRSSPRFGRPPVGHRPSPSTHRPPPSAPSAPPQTRHSTSMAGRIPIGKAILMTTAVTVLGYSVMACKSPDSRPTFSSPSRQVARAHPLVDQLAGRVESVRRRKGC